MTPPPVSPVALVLAGGAARGAYEVGVIQYLLEDVGKAVGFELPIDILCGTSIGAINACALAAFADDPRTRAARLAKVWTELRLENLVKPDLRGLVSLGTTWLRSEREGGLVDPAGLERLVRSVIPFPAIDENLRAGRLSALTVSTTHIASGRTVVFVHRRDRGLPPWSLDPTIEPRAVQMAPEHAFASAAIPLLFRAVRIDGELHCDGGLRQNVPLSPARRLGARGVIVVNPRYIPRPEVTRAPRNEPEAFAGLSFILGKTLNALLLDRIDTDLARLESINEILEAGRVRYGEDFAADINAALGRPKGHGMRTMRSLLVRASVDIGRVATDYVRSPSFAARVTGGAAKILRRIADRDPTGESDLLSYLLFDGEFARRLIEIGHDDARSRHDELCQFFIENRAGSHPSARPRNDDG